MATIKQAKDFFDLLSKEVIKQAKENGYNYPSAILAQAAHESNYGISTLGSKYHNYFGMKCPKGWKGKSVNMKTWEEYEPGVYTDITANFRAYDTVEEGIEGYFTFLKYVRYKNLKEATSSYDYINKIKEDGWATDSHYVEQITYIIDKYDLLKYDNIKEEQKPVEEPKKTTKSNYSKYTVVRGDSLWLIARKQLGNALRWKEIQELNGLTSTVIHVGQVLKIPVK